MIYIISIKFGQHAIKKYDYYLSSEHLHPNLQKVLNHTKKLELDNSSIEIMNYDGRKTTVFLSHITTLDQSNGSATKNIKIIDRDFLITNRYLKNPHEGKEILKELQDDLDKNKTTGGDDPMKNTFNQFGQKINGIFAISLFDGSPAYKLNGTHVAVKDGDLVDVSEFVMEIDIPGFTMPALLKDVKVNDLVKVNGELVIVSSVEESSIKVIKGDGAITEVAPIVNPLFGGAFVTKVMNPMAGMTGQGQGIGGFNPMMFIMMGDNKGNDMFKTMMMMQMMQQQGGFFNQQTPKQETK